MKSCPVLLSLLLFAACSEEGGSARGPCHQFDWRSETQNQIVCPYTPDCVCSSTDVCCVTVENQEFQGAACQPLASCSGLAYECDGPEDCPTGEVCCVDVEFGDGSSCVVPDDCTGSEDAIMCRQADDCPPGQECYPGITDSLFENVAGYCELT